MGRMPGVVATPNLLDALRRRRERSVWPHRQVDERDQVEIASATAPARLRAQRPGHVPRLRSSRPCGAPPGPPARSARPRPGGTPHHRSGGNRCARSWARTPDRAATRRLPRPRRPGQFRPATRPTSRPSTRAANGPRASTGVRRRDRVPRRLLHTWRVSRMPGRTAAQGPHLSQPTLGKRDLGPLETGATEAPAARASSRCPSPGGARVRAHANAAVVVQVVGVANAHGNQPVEDALGIAESRAEHDAKGARLRPLPAYGHRRSASSNCPLHRVSRAVR